MATFCDHVDENEILLNAEKNIPKKCITCRKQDDHLISSDTHNNHLLSVGTSVTNVSDLGVAIVSEMDDHIDVLEDSPLLINVTRCIFLVLRLLYNKQF